MRRSGSVLSFALVVVFAAEVRANDWYVDANSSPGGDGSPGNPFDTIGDALAVAVTGDRVFVAPATYVENLTIAASIELRGTGSTPDETLVALPLFSRSWGIKVEIGHVVVLQNLRVSGSDTYPYAYGSGIWNLGTLYVNDCVIRDCIEHESTFGHGNATAYGGGILNDGTLSLVDCTIADNTALAEAFGFETSRGGGIANRGTARLEGCTISGNVCEGALGGAEYGEGGGIWSNGPLELVNCTVSGNRIDAEDAFGAGIWQTGPAPRLRSCTIAENSADGDYGDFNDGGGLFGTYIADHLIVADNVLGDGGGVGPDFHGTLDSLGYNLIGEDDGMTVIGDETGNLYDVDPLLDPLADNGGRVQTHALGAGSPAIDSGNPDPTLVVANDGRRFGRDLIARRVGVADLGAVEMGAVEALDLRATPDRELVAGYFVSLEVRQGLAGAPFALFFVEFNGLPLFELGAVDVLDSSGGWFLRAVVPNDPTLLGATLSMRAFSVDANGRLIGSPEEPIDFL